MAASPEEIRRWIRGRRAAELRILQELRDEPVNRAEAIHRALALMAATALTRGWPPPSDPMDEREDLEAYRCWTRLRRGWPR